MYESEDPESEEVAEAQEKVKKLELDQGWHAVREKLREVDRVSFQNIHENDQYRTTRALEYFFIHNKPISEQKEKMEEAGPYDFSRLRNPHWQLHHIYLEVPKEDHWPIMEKRAQEMLAAGLLNEVNDLKNSGLDLNLKPLQSIGYKECFELLSGNKSPRDLKDEQIEELTERIYINTRRLAKSQKTFFKKINPKNTYNPLEDHAKIVENLQDFIKEINYGR
jgi:tRNA dimethylallyltransferase